ncbi:hypothetical protein C8J56DRAFT_794967, partial [Mycena floridula]
EFTYTHKANNHKSRLYRIYVNGKIFDCCYDWEIETPEDVLTDHLLVSVKISSDDGPKVGQGRPVIPRHLWHDGELFRMFKQDG